MFTMDMELFRLIVRFGLLAFDYLYEVYFDLQKKLSYLVAWEIKLSH